MNYLVDFFSIFSISQILVAIALLAPHWAKSQSLRLYVIFMACGVLHVFDILLSGHTLPELVKVVLYAGNNALPGIFWLVSLSVFGEHITIKRWHYTVASLTLLIPMSAAAVQNLFGFTLDNYDAIKGLIVYGALALELTLVVHALIIVGKYWDSDLVQRRRYIRGGVIGAAALYIFLVIVIEQLLKLSWTGLPLLEVFSLTLLLSAINIFLFQLSANSIFEQGDNKPDNIKSTAAVSKELSAVIHAMEQEKLYQQEGLTITAFAKTLAIHEYKLRALINGELAFRNFNDFLNHYRINEVTQKLENKTDKQLPVLTLALESGFRSLSSFNKAFKEKHGVTPTEYRKRANS